MRPQEALQRFESLMQTMNIVKAAPGVIGPDNTTFGGVIPYPAVLELLALTRKQNAWLDKISNRTRVAPSGVVPILDFEEPVMEGVSPGSGEPITNLPGTTMAYYACKNFRADWVVLMDELEEAAAAGLTNFEDQVRASFADALGNCIADVVMNSSIALPATTKRNRMLRMVDGVRVLMDSANVYDAAGKAFDQGIFAAMLDLLPDKYANEPGLMWWFNRKIDIAWHKSLTNVSTTERMRSALGDQAISSPIKVPPLGVDQLIIPQISSSQGPAAIAPTSAADDGDGTMTFVLTTLVTAAYVATAALGVGRKFIVTCKTTGVTEVCTGYLDTTLRIATLGSLGQDIISATATDYTVTLYDETDLYLGNPKMITLVQSTEVKSYRVFNPKMNRWEITTWLKMDVLVPTPQVGVKFKRVARPAITW